MMLLIDVQCPHCGAQGQIILPSLGDVIVGPCPECHGMLAIFCGECLALDNEIFLNGTTEEKEKYLAEVLTEFVNDKVDAIFGQAGTLPARRAAGNQSPRYRQITDGEVDAFRTELKFLDNGKYFAKVFGPGRRKK